jgi:hypothetical protein
LPQEDHSHQDSYRLKQLGLNWERRTFGTDEPLYLLMELFYGAKNDLTCTLPCTSSEPCDLALTGSNQGSNHGLSLSLCCIYVITLVPILPLSVSLEPNESSCSHCANERWHKQWVATCNLEKICNGMTHQSTVAGRKAALSF